MIEFDISTELHGGAGVMQWSAQGSLERGEFAALFGPSGAGKTTLLHMLAGLGMPRQGTIKVDGVTWFDAARNINRSPQRRSIGLVFQDQALFPNLTVRQNVGYALARNEDRWLAELIELSGLGELQDRLPAGLSGGQKQRVALVRAIARKPALLLLDEPLSALDSVVRLQLQDELHKLHQRFGLTTLMVSHDVGEVFRLAQRVLRMENGLIVQSASPAQVFLHRRAAGKLQLQAQVLEIRREDVIYTLSLLIGQEIVDVVASPEEALQLRVGESISVAAKSFSPLLFKQ
ncbi:MAG TPA: ATP-binding cassette domain-containing protein [Burkholderiaceae bacterium]